MMVDNDGRVKGVLKAGEGGTAKGVEVLQGGTGLGGWARDRDRGETRDCEAFFVRD